MKTTMIVLVVAVLILLTGIALAANGLTIRRHLIGGGGGSVQSGDFSLQGSVGQAVAGEVGSGSVDVISGFWKPVRSYPVYLPLVVKNLP